jgi:phospholipid/cholesterol/gamma-HCH transport system substrate-binding protein
MGSKPPSLASIATAVAFALACFCATLFVWKAFGGTTPFQAQGYRFKASFSADATNLTGGSSVRIAGVPVGKVVRVQGKNGRFEATIELKRRYAPIHTDAHAITRIKTLLGETFVELTPGTPSAPKLAEGGSLAPGNIGEPQAIDQVLGAFDAKTRGEFKNFLKDFSVALKGRGADINATLGNAAPTTQELDRLVTTLDAERPAVRALIRDAGTALTAVGARSADVQDLVRSGDAVFGATAARNRELTATVRALPPFLRQAREALTILSGVAGDAAPTLATLRPVAPLVRPALLAATTLAPQLTGTFRELRPVLAAAVPAFPALQRTLKAARPLLKQLEDAGRELVPVVQYANLYRDNAVTSIANLGAATQAVDGQGRHYLRTVIPIINESIGGQAKRFGTNRHNAYPAPREIADIAGGNGLSSSDCRNAGNPTPVTIGSGAPPCRGPKLKTIQGKTSYYPNLVRTAP